MRAGHWRVDTGETLKFDTEGALIDGQNRLYAVVQAGVPVDFDVVYDVPPESMTVIDTGAPRLFGDVLIIGGAGSVRKEVASIVRWLMLWDLGIPRGTGGSVAPTHSEMMERYRLDPGLYEAAAARGRDCSRRGIGNGSMLGVAYVIFRGIDPELTHQFFDILLTGANVAELHPVKTLRDRLLRSKSDRATRPEQLAMCVRAWNAFRAGKTLTTIIITKSGDLTNANFPMPK
jgi:hypothetical protein